MKAWNALAKAVEHANSDCVKTVDLVHEDRCIGSVEVVDGQVLINKFNPTVEEFFSGDWDIEY